MGKEGRVAPADAAALASIASHLSFDGITVANAVIPASTKVAVAPLASGGKGAVAVQGSDGHVQSSGVTATADGALLAASLGPAEGAKAVAITSAELTDPVVTGGTIAQAKSVATATLEVCFRAPRDDDRFLPHFCLCSAPLHTAPQVTGKSDLCLEGAGCSTTVGGSLTVHGTVVGAGPYMDSSDARFKGQVRDKQGREREGASGERPRGQ